MSKPLFSEFEPVPAKAFKQQIQVDLKGASYNDSVVWNSPEGIHVKPFYHREDTQERTFIPGQPSRWRIGEEIFVIDPEVSANTANQAIKSGTEALFFKAEKTFKIADLLTKIEDKSIPIYFNLEFLDTDFYQKLLKTASELEQKIHLNPDIIGHLARTGNWFNSLNEDFNKITQLFNFQNNNILNVDTSLYQQAGAGIIQQLAYALAHVNEYLNAFSGNLKQHKINFHVAVGSNYFFEIAKIRSLRYLYALLAEAYHLPKTCHITAAPSRRNKVLYDYNTNMLRTTTECMSAVLGGADTVLNLPYDALYHKTNAFAQRISRNQLLILKEESYFQATTNPAEGSYYIESLTRQLSEEALKVFKEIEQGGGFLEQLKKGIIQRKIKEQAATEQQAFDKKEKILVGTNRYPNPEDRMKQELELYPFVKKKVRKTLIEPIIPYRLAETLEQERLENEAQ